MNNPFDEFNNKLIRIETLLLENNSIKEKHWKNQELLLTRQETAKLLRISLTTLYYWTKKAKIPAYSISNRLYYKRSEIEASLIKIN